MQEPYYRQLIGSGQQQVGEGYPYNTLRKLTFFRPWLQENTFKI